MNECLTTKLSEWRFYDIEFLSSSSQNVYTRFRDFKSFCTLKFLHQELFSREKNDFSRPDLGIAPKDRIQAAVKIKYDGEILWKLYEMLKGAVRIYNDYQIVH